MVKFNRLQCTAWKFNEGLICWIFLKCYLCCFLGNRFQPQKATMFMLNNTNISTLVMVNAQRVHPRCRGQFLCWNRWCHGRRNCLFLGCDANNAADPSFPQTPALAKNSEKRILNKWVAHTLIHTGVECNWLFLNLIKYSERWKCMRPHLCVHDKNLVKLWRKI